MVNIEKIKSLLEAPDEELRIEGLHYMIGVRGDKFVDLLIKALGDESWRVRKASIALVVEYGEALKMLPLLIDCLRNDENAGLRNAAAEAIERIGIEATDIIVEYIKDEDHDLRKLIIDILGNIGDRKSTPFLIEALDDHDENVKSSAAENLGKIGDNKAVKSLLKALEKDDLLLQFSSLEALYQIGQPIPVDTIIPLLKNPLLKKAAYDSLGKSYDIRALPFLIKGLEERSKSTKRSAVISISRLIESLDDPEEGISILLVKKSSLPELVLSCLDSRDSEVTISAVKVLGWLKSSECITELLPLSQHDEMAPFIIDVIAGFGIEGENDLIESYRYGPDTLKPVICALLGEIKSMKGVDLLVEALKSDIGHVRNSSAVSLGKIGDKRVIRHILPLLDDKFPDVRDSAVQSLFMFSGIDRDAVFRVISEGIINGPPFYKQSCSRILALTGEDGDMDIALNALKAEDPVVRRNALEALSAIEKDDIDRYVILALSDEDRDVRIAAAAYLGKKKCKDGVKPLLSLLQDDDIWVRNAVIRAIAGIGVEEAGSHIVEMLDDEVGLIVIASLESLGKLAAPSYAPAMLKKMSDPDREVVKTALESLEFWDNQEYIDKLILMLDHDSWEVRVSAVRTIGKKKNKGYEKLLRTLARSEKEDLVLNAINEVLKNTND